MLSDEFIVNMQDIQDMRGTMIKNGFRTYADYVDFLAQQELEEREFYSNFTDSLLCDFVIGESYLDIAVIYDELYQDSEVQKEYERICEMNKENGYDG